VVLPTYPVGATVEGVAQVAQAAERLGFASVWTTDDVIMPPEEAGPYAEILEPLLTLAYVAPLTETVKLGVSVIVVPQRNGIVLAKELATLDRLCGGRLIAGVGAGWNETEFRMLDAGDRFHQRGAYLDETLRVWRHLWTAPETPFHGTFYDLPPVAFAPGPVQPGGPPIWVGGSSPAARRRAGAFGDAWHPVGIGAADLAEQAGLVRQAAAEAGRPMPELAPRLAIQFGEGSEALSATRMRTISGSPAEVIAALAAYADAGASEIVCLFNSPDGSVVVERMEQFAQQVMPALSKSGESKNPAPIAMGVGSG
jgi:probable F420-dependent oxidoreductase